MCNSEGTTHTANQISSPFSLLLLCVPQPSPVSLAPGHYQPTHRHIKKKETKEKKNNHEPLTRTTQPHVQKYVSNCPDITDFKVTQRYFFFLPPLCLSIPTNTNQVQHYKCVHTYYYVLLYTDGSRETVTGHDNVTSIPKISRQDRS